MTTATEKEVLISAIDKDTDAAREPIEIMIRSSVVLSRAEDERRDDEVLWHRLRDEWLSETAPARHHFTT
jgi:hypothetical protein